MRYQTPLQYRCQFRVYEGSATAEVLLQFLKRLRHDAKRPVFLVVDGHPMPKAKRIKDHVSEQGRLKLLGLPPYFAPSHPGEAVWANVKACVAKRTVNSKQDLKAKLLSARRRVQKLKKTL